MIYEEDQVKVIFPYITPSINQFILGGPADGNEAQAFHEEFPNVAITGFEPNAGFYQHQLANNFPGTLRSEALLDTSGAAYLSNQPGRQEGTVYDRGSRIQSSLKDGIEVTSITLDSLFSPAPKRSIALWIDIERSELKALRGAENLLQTGAIAVILFEAMGDTLSDLHDYLSSYGYYEEKFFNYHDHIYLLSEDR